MNLSESGREIEKDNEEGEEKRDRRQDEDVVLGIITIQFLDEDEASEEGIFNFSLFRSRGMAYILTFGVKNDFRRLKIGLTSDPGLFFFFLVGQACKQTNKH